MSILRKLSAVREGQVQTLLLRFVWRKINHFWGIQRSWSSRYVNWSLLCFFQLTFKIAVTFSYHHKWNTTAIEFLLLFFKTEFEFGFSKKNSSMAGIAPVHVGSFCGLHFQLFVFSHCLHKRKYSCFQDSSVIRRWFVYLVWIWEDFAAGFKSNLQAAECRAVFGPHLLVFGSYIQGEWALVIITILSRLSFL